MSARSQGHQWLVGSFSGHATPLKVGRLFEFIQRFLGGFVQRVPSLIGIDFYVSPDMLAGVLGCFELLPDGLSVRLERI